MSNMQFGADGLDIKTVVGGPVSVNTYVVGVKGGEYCLLIDPGAETQKVAAAVGNRQVSAVLLTHAHFDHMFYAEHWLSQGAKLYVHALDVPALTNPDLNLCSMIRASLIIDTPPIPVTEGSVIHEADLTLTVLHTPGHTTGSACFLCQGVLFSGDTLFYHSYGRVDFPGGSMVQMTESLRRLYQLDEKTIVYPGHDMKTMIAWERGMIL